MIFPWSESIKSVANNKLTDSAIEAGQLNILWGTVQGGFLTKDGSSIYHSTFKLVDGRLQGTTHAPSRELFSVSTALGSLKNDLSSKQHSRTQAAS